ncbi:Zinc finger MYM-type protein 1 [Linum perenne]
MSLKEQTTKRVKSKLLSYFIPTQKERATETEGERNSAIGSPQPQVTSQVIGDSSTQPSGSGTNRQSQLQSSFAIEVERDPGKRIKICEWPIELRDEVRRKYLLLEAFQPKLSEHTYQAREYGNKSRRFQESWYKEFHWLEYSPTSHKAYCFPCFLFDDNSSSNLVNGGFDNWRRVHKGKDCAFLNHIGTSSSSPHNKAVASAAGLRMPSAHIDRVLERVSRAEVLKHRLRLKTTIKVLQRLALQGCAFRGHDESESSLNRGNLIEWIEFLMEWREDVKAVLLKNAPGNAKYISPLIQKELLSIIANKVRCKIRVEVGDAYFAILVDEARDESGREQMAIILRYVNSNGILTERFFTIKCVADTSAATLKQVISDALSEYNLQVEKLRGQGYDGASNMSGQFNGLRALFLQDCSYAYFVHCFAHRLQLTLVAAAKHYRPMDNVINLVKSSPKRTTELIEAHQRDIDVMLTSGELETGRGANQMTSLHRAGTTRWSSHLHSVDSMIQMYGATCDVLEELNENGSTPQIRAEADGALKGITTFEFAFNLHMTKAIMCESHFLSQAFQKESVDILEALSYVSTTKCLLQELRDKGWESLLEMVRLFCFKHELEIPDLNKMHGRGAKKMQLEHLYHFEYLNQCIDHQLSELNSRFNEDTIRLLQLSVALDPKDSFKAFNADHICQLAEEFYPKDFDGRDILTLKTELPYYSEHVVRNSEFEVSSLAKLMEKLVTRRLDVQYIMICQLIRLVLTLTVSTATTERAFSAMKFVKTDIRNKMADDFLANSLMLFIERDYARKLDIDSIIDDFAKLKNRRV